MPRYQEQLQKELAAHHWEVASIADDGREWWWTQQWVVRSLQHAWGAELVLTFLVDPLSEGGPRTVASIAATESPPADRFAAVNGVARLDMFRGDFREKLHSFIDQLNAWRTRWPGKQA